MEIVALDLAGYQADSFFDVFVDPTPPSLDLTGPIELNEGETGVYDSGAADATSGISTIEWDLDDDGAFDDGFGPTADRLFSDDGVFVIRVQSTDAAGNGPTIASLTVTVLNVAPTLDAGADQTVDEGDLVSLAPATFNDQGSADTHTATIDWGDGILLETGVVSESPFGPPGSTAGADGTVSGSHAYADNGIYTVTVCVTDDDGGVGCDDFVVTVLTTGFPPDPGLEEEVEATLDFFDTAVSEGALIGDGPGLSGAGRLGALRNMLEEARDLILEGRTRRPGRN